MNNINGWPTSDPIINWVGLGSNIKSKMNLGLTQPNEFRELMPVCRQFFIRDFTISPHYPGPIPNSNGSNLDIMLNF